LQQGWHALGGGLVELRTASPEGGRFSAILFLYMGCSESRRGYQHLRFSGINRHKFSVVVVKDGLDNIVTALAKAFREVLQGPG
jgi:hypothetical protein